MTYGIELSTGKRVKILDKSHYLYFIAYVDEAGRELHPNAIAWAAHRSVKLDEGKQC